MKKCFFSCFKPRNNLKKNLWNFGGLQKFLHEFRQICPQTIFFLKTQNFNFQIGVIFAIIYIFLWGWNMFERYLGCFHTCRNFCPNHPQTKIIQPKNWKKSKKMTFFQIWYMAEISAPWQKFLQFWKFWIFLCSQSRSHGIPPINQTKIIQPKNWKKSKKITFFQIWYMAEISAHDRNFYNFENFEYFCVPKAGVMKLHQ